MCQTLCFIEHSSLICLQFVAAFSYCNGRVSNTIWPAKQKIFTYLGLRENFYLCLILRQRWNHSDLLKATWKRTDTLIKCLISIRLRGTQTHYSAVIPSLFLSLSLFLLIPFLPPSPSISCLFLSLLLPSFLLFLSSSNLLLLFLHFNLQQSFL